MEGLRIVVAPDKFKGSLSATEAARAIGRGLRGVAGCVRELACIPMADGGEGTVDVFLENRARPEIRTVRGPLGAPVAATFALVDSRLAVIEMAAASGLQLLGDRERDPMRASTYGTGELLCAALALGVDRIVLGIGGSATNDGGAGLLAALGVRLLDAGGEDLAPGGAALARLASIDISDLDSRIGQTTIEVASDVDNTLCGRHGASQMFGAQKGASEAQIRTLDAALAHFADLSARIVHADYRDEPGAGAAGGLGFGLLAYLGVVIRPGVEVIADVRGLAAALHGADLCITGEGRIDAQTLRGKTVAGVARLARDANVPAIAFTGWLEAGAEAELLQSGVAATFPITDKPMALDDALRDAASLLTDAAARVGHLLMLRHTVADHGSSITS